MNMEQQRAAFEAQFPMPRDCVWCGSGYAPTSYNAWDAQAYANKWEGWKAAIEQDRQSQGELCYGVYRQRNDENGGREFLNYALHHDQTALSEGERIVKGLFVPDTEGSPQPAEPVKCDGNHGGPRCADPGCWNDSPAEPVKEPSDPSIHNVEQVSAWADAYAREGGHGLIVQMLRGYADLLASYGNAAQPAASAEPVPFVLGNVYFTQAGDMVRFVKVHNEGTPHETMEDESGVNRYTRRDFGRVTGSPHDYSEPRNTPPLYTAPVAAQPSVPWGNFPGYLIDHCEGDIITEEGLQHALSDMLRDPQYATPPAGGQAQQDAVTCGNGCECLTECGDTYDYQGKPKPPKRQHADKVAGTIQARAIQLTHDAVNSGMVVRIDLVSRKPLAMGNLDMVVDVRPARAKQGGQV